jgi:hypothetical protein
MGRNVPCNQGGMMGIIIVLGIFIGGIHLVNWLITKGIIFVMLQLFQIDWRNKFWVVYLFLILIGIIFRGLANFSQKEN